MHKCQKYTGSIVTKRHAIACGHESSHRTEEIPCFFQTPVFKLGNAYQVRVTVHPSDIAIGDCKFDASPSAFQYFIISL